MASTQPRKLLERVLERDRWIVLGGLLAVAALAWGYTLAGVGMDMSALEMTRHAAMGMGAAAGPVMPWTASHAAVMLAMWWIMMVAMMLPSATPTILLAAALNRRAAGKRPFGAAGLFTAGYLLAWLFFSVLAVTAQWALQVSGQLSAMLRAVGAEVSGALLIAAGLWQFSPVKQACLRHCRSPVDFLIQRRRPGHLGALLMGLEHGTYCLGCCWFLMALLFVGGVMNLYWIVGLALYVLLEKMLPRGQWLGRAAGVGLLLAGVAVLLG